MPCAQTPADPLAHQSGARSISMTGPFMIYFGGPCTYMPPHGPPSAQRIRKNEDRRGEPSRALRVLHR
ncbi:hypothetical protein NOVOSPHI9U_40446 [Novosphingobium sp. 9U]|nr:hypothetical protein NOVOSPHI9U_40446 [Novosphingobium sp. 9U]